MHAETNDLTKGKNVLNNVKRTIISVKKFSPETKLVSSSLIGWKDKKNMDKEVLEKIARLGNFCNQKNIDCIDDTNIKENHLDMKKLHLNNRGTSVFAQNLLRYLQLKYWENVNFNCFAEIYIECKSKNLSECLTNSYKENFKDICKK